MFQTTSFIYDKMTVKAVVVSSRNHTLPYSAIGLQELNLRYFYPQIYWNTGCLTINAAANQDVESNKATNYGRLAKAISDMKKQGVKVALPDITTADFEFSPDEKNNQIIYGLKGINAVSNDTVESIISKRPYNSLVDFLEKHNNEYDIRVIINLIKAGCFDIIEGKDRNKIMADFITYYANQKITDKDKLSLSNLLNIVEVGILPQRFDFIRRLFHFRKYIFSTGARKSIEHKNGYILDEFAVEFFNKYCACDLIEGQDYFYENDNLTVLKTKFEKWYKIKTETIKDWLAEPNTLAQYNKAAKQQYFDELWNKYCLGNNSEWEMQSLSFYHGKHELADVNANKYHIVDFNDIPSTPIETEKGRYQLYTLAGTVLDKNANTHHITLLTTSDVVTVKFHRELFSYYDKQLSVKTEKQNKKTVIERSWLKKGNKLLITGFRRDNTFYPKRYYNTITQHTVRLIEKVFDNGDLMLKQEREKV